MSWNDWPHARGTGGHMSWNTQYCAGVTGDHSANSAVKAFLDWLISFSKNQQNAESLPSKKSPPE
jgi:hypothetical protein